MRLTQFTGSDSDNALHGGPRLESFEFILEAMHRAVKRVKRARKWHLVDPLSKAFIKACSMMKLTRIKSMQLFKAIIKTVRKLKELVLEDHIPVKAGIRQAWKISMLASSWGHPNAQNWKNDKAFILYQALTLKWLSKLFGGVILNEL